MTVTRIQYTQTYVQDEHQRVLQNLADTIAQLEAKIATLQAVVKVLRTKAGV